MSGNTLKTPLVRSNNRFVETKVRDAIQLLGKALPCSVVSVDGQIVVVKFELNSAPFTLPNVTVPISTSLYDWLPIRAGDLGVVRPIDTYLGGISGLGGGVADLSARANLSTLVFDPVAHTSWSVPDPEKRVVQGPAGVILRDLGNGTVFTLSSDGIVITVGATTVTIDASGITVDGGDVVADTIALKTHRHTGVQPGGGTSGPPVP